MACMGLDDAAASALSGSLTDTKGNVIPGGTISVVRRADLSRLVTTTNQNGQFSFGSIEPGEYHLTAEAAGFAALTRTVVVLADGSKSVDVYFSNLASQNESVTVSADVSDVGVFVPDPAEPVMIRDETLDANPGRPGIMIRVPRILLSPIRRRAA
jgi:hypothetical protein